MENSTLIGTEKQVSWALKIKSAKIAEYSNDIKRISIEQKRVPVGSDYFKKCEMWLEEANENLNAFLNATSAKWIIDRRF